jgi:hypothetical protein
MIASLEAIDIALRLFRSPQMRSRLLRARAERLRAQPLPKRRAVTRRSVLFYQSWPSPLTAMRQRGWLRRTRAKLVLSIKGRT